jgi:dihydroorotate dehydrogenase electron transfer subunit
MSEYTHFPYTIDEVIQESTLVRSFLVTTSKELDVNPGQFMMVWIPGKSEKNIPVSYAIPYEGRIGFTIKMRTPAPAICEICNSCGVCEELFEMKKGDVIRVRGPYGKGFTIQGQNLFLAGSETRIAPLVLLAEQARSMGRKVTATVVAPNEERLVFVQRLESLGVDVRTIIEKNQSSIAADVNELLEKKTQFDSAYLYATEEISKALMDITSGHKIPTQVMIERDIHCGTGICGECSIDPTGWRVCVEGPVFWEEDLRDSEFGRYRRHSLKKRELRKGE